jgi:preprotein translocase subunit SecE
VVLFASLIIAAMIFVIDTVFERVMNFIYSELEL